MITGIGDRLQQLIDYLNITYNAFAKECGIMNYTIIKKIATGETQNPTTPTLNKILSRYPVREEWFVFGSGEMWEEDYFTKRFNDLHKNYIGKSHAEKMKGLVEIFEMTATAFAIRISINRDVILQIMKGDIHKITERIQNNIISEFKFIPKEYFNNV